ncbi:hydrogenase expression/formation protein HypE [Clostridium oryzae]|uniref:Hydrogenase expression/formation protein HypE n=1 Tax=Clostridium oryzae TaxID=1450648 RepID=A0A1V4IMB6_9CLOT|nr:hydrogenase expression/formation protein HypE [Clostridium oryzae]OPJ60984.1 hydrogenase expression/formation protein HypE [Clostridium oryzae]
MDKVIRRVHGDGGKYTNELIEQIFYKYFDNELLRKGVDSAAFPVKEGSMTFTTDSFVVRPIFFPGGDIGKLAVCGTINDLSVSGSKPLYLSCSFIIEEGFSIDILEHIVNSMAQQCTASKVSIVTGDTKVIESSGQNGIYINTAGVGVVQNNYMIKTIEPGDSIIVSGNIGEHGTTIVVDRFNMNLKGDFKSDCAPVYEIVDVVKDYFPYIKIMKDPTRGGLATIINEISTYSGLGVKLIEENIPISKEISAINDMLGTDPLYMACEGRIVLVVKEDKATEVLTAMRTLDQCRNAAIIGNFFMTEFPVVYAENYFGGKRILNMFDAEMLPRIC